MVVVAAVLIQVVAILLPLLCFHVLRSTLQSVVLTVLVAATVVMVLMAITVVMVIVTVTVVIVLMAITVVMVLVHGHVPGGARGCCFGGRVRQRVPGLCCH